MTATKYSKNFRTRQESEVTLQRYLDEITQIPALSREEEVELIPAAQRGDEKAFDKIIRSNLRFVVTIAREYENRGMSLMDLISEGNLGLIRALQSFDVDRGTKFITYAKWWIRQSIVYALIYKNHLVRLPQNQVRKISRINKAVEELQKVLHREPTEHEVADNLGMDESPAKVLAKYFANPQSLDAPIERDTSDRLLDLLPNKESSPDSRLTDESLKLDIEIAFSSLKKREMTILRLLYGLEGERSLTLGEVAEQFGISRERVRQIKNAALEKLRESEEVRSALLSYFD